MLVNIYFQGSHILRDLGSFELNQKRQFSNVPKSNKYELSYINL